MPTSSSTSLVRFKRLCLERSSSIAHLRARKSILWTDNLAFVFLVFLSLTRPLLSSLAINGSGFKVLNEGDIITYDTEERAKGIVATNVNVIQPNPSPPRRRAPRVRLYLPLTHPFKALHTAQ